MYNNKSVTGIILAAGNSSRYGKNINKNFEQINDKYILEFSLIAFNENKYIDEIIVILKDSERKIVEKILLRHKYKKEIKLINGGSTRNESVYNGIKETESDIILIHDGARAAIKDEYINKCIEAMEEYKGATIAVRSKDTIKVADENNIVINTPKRNNTWQVQTPQCFNRKILLEEILKYNFSSDITDECSLLEDAGYEVKLICGDYSNIKLTDSDDLKILNVILQK